MVTFECIFVWLRAEGEPERERESLSFGGEKNSPNDLNPSFIRLRGGGREGGRPFPFLARAEQREKSFQVMSGTK
jgi:hypothetical protein